MLADIAAIVGDLESATRIFGGVDGVFAAAAATCTPLTAILGPPDVDALRDQLGREAFDRFCSEGRASSAEELVDYLSRSRGPNRRATVGWDSLTPTELAVVRLVAEGLTNQAIGDQLFVSSGTVKSHLAHVYDKLGAANRAEVAAEVARRAATTD